MFAQSPDGLDESGMWKPPQPLGSAPYCCGSSFRTCNRYRTRVVCTHAGFPMGESRANPMYWDEDTRRTWATFVSGSKSTLVRQDAWWDIADVQQQDSRVDNVDWNA